MANQLYEDDKIAFPGDFRISEVALVSAYGNVVGISANVMEVNIYEDINNNFLTGDITFADTDDVMSKLPILGQEFLEFKVRTPLKSKYNEGEYDFTNVRMAVYKVARKIKTNSNTQVLTLDFISPEGVRDQNIRISRAFNGPYDDAVAKIFKKEWGLNSKKKLYIQPTKNDFKFVAPNSRPTDILNMIASRAVPKTSILPAYVFYENGQGFHFRSLDSFFFIVKASGLAQHPEMFEYFCDADITKGNTNPRDNPMASMRNVIKYRFNSHLDIIRAQRMGTFSSKLITYDAYNKTIKTDKYNYIEDYLNVPHLEKDDANTDQALYRGLIAKAHYDPNDLSTAITDKTNRTAYKYLSDYSDSRLMFQSNTANIHNVNAAKGYRTDEYVQRRQSALELFKTLELQLTVPGNTHLNIGHVIRVNIPRSGRDKQGNRLTDNDRLHTGRWVITAVRHNFNFDKPYHISVITCVKETYGRNLQDKTTPLTFDTTDEGKPINLYDDSEYN